MSKNAPGRAAAAAVLIVLQAAFAVVLIAQCRRAASGESGVKIDEEKLWSNVPIKEWRYIVIHHSATKEGNAAVFDKFHREERGWSGGLGYDFVICNGRGAPDGEIEVGPRWINQQSGAHAGNTEYNEYGIGICLVGDFTDARPTDRQMQSLVELCRVLMRHCRIDAGHVIGHREVSGKSTECPGKMFDMDELRRTLRSGR